jgi:hypothetical protein
LLHLADFLYAIDVFNLSLTCQHHLRLFESDFKSLGERLESRPHVTSKTDSTKKEGRKLPLWVLLFLRQKKCVPDNPAGRAYVRRLRAEYYEKNILAYFEIVENNDLDEKKKREELKRAAPHVRLLLLEAAFKKYAFGSRQRLFIEDCIIKEIFRQVPWDDLLRNALQQRVASLLDLSSEKAYSECSGCPEVKFLIDQGANQSILTGFIHNLQLGRGQRDQTQRRSMAASGQAQRSRGNGIRRVLLSTPR